MQWTNSLLLKIGFHTHIHSEMDDWDARMTVATFFVVEENALLSIGQ